MTDQHAPPDDVAESAPSQHTMTLGQMEGEPPSGPSPRRKDYSRQLRSLQIEMLKLQRWVKEREERVLILFEGRDAAGKGGAIRRFTEHLNPRGARIVALSKPSDVERTQWYFQRYVAHLPAGGELVFFDRSWYNRAGVEIVMGFCSVREHAEFLGQVPDLEQSLVDAGMRLFKLWFTVSKDEQRQRFEDRRSDPLRHWKLSPIDAAALDKWDHYGAARDEMLLHTDRPSTPWTVVNSNDKRRARLESMRHVLHAIPYAHKDDAVVGVPDPRVVRPAAELLAGVNPRTGA